MARAIVVRGRLSDPLHVDLDEPVSGIGGPVEVTLRPIAELAAGSPAAVLHAMRALPRLEPGDVDDLERMIEDGKLPTGAEGIFDHKGA
jgi:hypothetical protein